MAPQSTGNSTASTFRADAPGRPQQAWPRPQPLGSPVPHSLLVSAHSAGRCPPAPPGLEASTSLALRPTASWSPQGPLNRNSCGRSPWRWCVGGQWGRLRLEGFGGECGPARTPGSPLGVSEDPSPSPCPWSSGAPGGRRQASVLAHSSRVLFVLLWSSCWSFCPHAWLQAALELGG